MDPLRIDRLCPFLLAPPSLEYHQPCSPACAVLVDKDAVLVVAFASIPVCVRERGWNYLVPETKV